MFIKEKLYNSTILIVDDAPENIDVLSEVLHEYKRKVTTNGHSAIAIAQSGYPPDLILLDVVMPEMDGFDVCKILKSDEKTKNIPVIFMTSLTDEDDKVKGFQAGAVDYITKPVHPKEVLARVETHLSLHLLRKELEENNRALEQKVQDRTKELQDAKEKAEESSKLKSNILLLMSHELRTPMNGILGLTQILNEEISNVLLKRYLDMLYSSGIRLKNSFEAILNLSHIEFGNQEIKKVKIDIKEKLSSIISTFLAEAEKKKLQLNFICNISDSEYKTDEVMFDTIVKNILDNALKYTHKGKIDVELSDELKDKNRWFVIKFSDTGIGIPNDKFGVIFEAFRQVEEGMGRTYEGTGLGLSITKKYIELLKGELTVESEIFKGSVFTVKLPFGSVASGETAVGSNEDEAGKGKTDAQKQLAAILYVEDDEANRTFMQIMSRGLCTVDLVINGESAIELVKSKKYDGIFMDINLGYGLNGIETTKRIREIEGYENIPIAAVTAFASEIDKDRFLSEGCSHFLAKPFMKKDIKELLNAFFG